MNIAAMSLSRNNFCLDHLRDVIDMQEGMNWETEICQRCPIIMLKKEKKKVLDLKATLLVGGICSLQKEKPLPNTVERSPPFLLILFYHLILKSVPLKRNPGGAYISCF